MSSLALWKDKIIKALSGGGQEKRDRQIKSGKKLARERLDLLLDLNSFEEIDQLGASQFLKIKEYTDGVITGFGTINERRVGVYAQDFTVKGGSLGKRHAEKICKVMDMCAKIGCPIIGIIDSGGARIDEGVHALAGYGNIFMRNVRYSGVIPQISIILGPCAGGATYSPALTDIIFTVKDISNLFITGPQVVEKALGEKITKEELGGALVHAQKSGVAHVISQTEEECFESVKEFLSFIPQNFCDTQTLISYSGQGAGVIQESVNCPGLTAGTVVGDVSGQNFINHTGCQAGVMPEGALGQNTKNFLWGLVPSSINQAYDIKNIIYSLVDNNNFFEIQELFASNIVIGLARISGFSVGIVANQPLVKAGAIDINASCKAARFINFCDSFSIPIISLVDVPGFLPGVSQEHDGIVRHGAKLIYAYARASVPKITVILRKAFGGAYVVMGSKELGADFNFAWPEAQIAVLSAQAAYSVLYKNNIDKDKETFEKEYEEKYLNPFVAAQYGYIDAIISPDQTKDRIINALKITQNKIEVGIKRKHGNIPL